MYCPSCGAESALDLNYCNRCGANMAVAVAPVRELVPISLTKPAVVIGLTAALITLGGFAILVEGAVKLSHAFQQSDPVTALVALGMTTIFVTDIMLIRVLSRIVKGSLEQAKQMPSSLTKPPGREIPRQLSPQLEPVPSVTEHTTRTFAPVFREPSDRGPK
jgi:hypothetical protein